MRWKKERNVNLNVILIGRAYQPLGQVEQDHMLQIFDPCNLMSNPSLIKFLKTKRYKIQKKKLEWKNALKSD